MSERRQTPRWHIHKAAQVKVQGEFVDCVVEDLNLKGLRLSLAQKLPANDRLHITLSFSESLGLDMRVDVPWSQQYGSRYVYGLSFAIIADGDREKIYQYLSHHFPEQFQSKWWPESQKS